MQIQIQISLLLSQESRASNTLNVSLDENNVIDIYQGKLKEASDPEAIGIYKITSQEILRHGDTIV